MLQLPALVLESGASCEDMGLGTYCRPVVAMAPFLSAPILEKYSTILLQVLLDVQSFHHCNIRLVCDGPQVEKHRNVKHLCCH